MTVNKTIVRRGNPLSEFGDKYQHLSKLLFGNAAVNVNEKYFLETMMSYLKQIITLLYVFGKRKLASSDCRATV